jgi:hypothetical protein
MKSKWGYIYIYWLKGEISFIVKMAKVSMKSGLFSRGSTTTIKIGVFVGMVDPFFLVP